MHKCITTWIDSSLPELFTTSWLPSHIDLCCFKVTVLTPLQWRHRTLSSFGFPTYPHSSRMCSPLSVSNNIAAFALDLKSTYEGEHMIFGLLSLANLAQDDVLQFHPFSFTIIPYCHTFISSSAISHKYICYDFCSKKSIIMTYI
jgi:hypothetical protein